MFGSFHTKVRRESPREDQVASCSMGETSCSMGETSCESSFESAVQLSLTLDAADSSFQSSTTTDCLQMTEVQSNSFSNLQDHANIQGNQYTATASLHRQPSSSASSSSSSSSSSSFSLTSSSSSTSSTSFAEIVSSEMEKVASVSSEMKKVAWDERMTSVLLYAISVESIESSNKHLNWSEISKRFRKILPFHNILEQSMQDKFKSLQKATNQLKGIMRPLQFIRQLRHCKKQSIQNLKQLRSPQDLSEASDLVYEEPDERLNEACDLLNKMSENDLLVVNECSERLSKLIPPIHTSVGERCAQRISDEYLNQFLLKLAEKGLTEPLDRELDEWESVQEELNKLHGSEVDKKAQLNAVYWKIKGIKRECSRSKLAPFYHHMVTLYPDVRFVIPDIFVPPYIDIFVSPYKYPKQGFTKKVPQTTHQGLGKLRKNTLQLNSEHIQIMLISMAQVLHGNGKGPSAWESVSRSMSEKLNGKEFPKHTLKITFAKLQKNYDHLDVPSRELLRQLIKNKEIYDNDGDDDEVDDECFSEGEGSSKVESDEEEFSQVHVSTRSKRRVIYGTGSNEDDDDELPRDRESLLKEESSHGDGSSSNLLGSFILKQFGKRSYYGLIVSFQSPYWKVVYEDGDEEELDLNEIHQSQVEFNKVPSEKRNECQNWEIGRLKSLSGKILKKIKI